MRNKLASLFKMNSPQRSRASRPVRAVPYLKLELRQLLACIEVSGAISEDTTWDSTDGYCLIGDITIEEGITLDVQSDIQREDQSVHSITVQGNLEFNEIRSGDLQIMVAPTGNFTVNDSNLGCIGCEAPSFSATVEGRMNINDSDWKLAQLTVIDNGNAEFLGTTLTNQPVVEIAGRLTTTTTNFVVSDLRFLKSAEAQFTGSLIRGLTMDIAEESNVVVDGGSVLLFPELTITSELTVLDSWIESDNRIIASNANLIFENSRVRGELQVSGGSISIHDSYLETYEVHIGELTETSLTKNYITGGILDIRAEPSKLTWTENEFSGLGPQLTSSPANILTFKENTTGTNKVQDIFLTGTVTQEVVLPTFDSFLVREYQILDVLTIEAEASLTFEPQVQVYQGTIEVAGTLNGNGIYLSVQHINVNDGGEFNLTDSSGSGEWVFNAGSGGTIEENTWNNATKIHSDSLVEFKSNFTTHNFYKIEAFGDPNGVVDLSNQYWHMNEDQIPERLIDHNDDPTRPTIKFLPIIADSPHNFHFDGTDGDDEFTIYVPLGGGKTTFSVNGGKEKSFFDDNQNRTSFDGLGGDDKVTLLIENVSTYEYFVGLDLTAEAVVATHYGLENNFLHRKVELLGFEDVEIEFIEDSTLKTSAAFHDSELNDEFSLGNQGASLSNEQYSQLVKGMSGVTASAENGGMDVATIRTPNVEDSYQFRDGTLKLISESQNQTATGFEETNVVAPESSDGQLTLWGTSDDERFTLGRGWATLGSDAQLVRGYNFSRVVSRGNGGTDTALLMDSKLDDALFTRPGQAFLSNENGSFGTAIGYSQITVTSGFGNDSASLDGSQGDDELFGNPEFTQLKADGQSVIARGFKSVSARSLGGEDSAFLNDSPLDDKFVGSEVYSAISNESFRVGVVRFQNVLAKSTVGFDVAHLSDGSGDDIFFASPTLARINHSIGTERTALAFNNVFVNASGGIDSAFFRDSEGEDVFVAKPDSALMSGEGYQNFAIGFESNSATSTNGNDVARFVDSIGNDSLFADSVQTRLKGNGFNNFTTGFQRNLVFSRGGTDSAFLVDSEDKDFLGTDNNDLWMFNDDYYRFISGFEKVEAGAVNGGINRANAADATFELDLFGDWLI